MRRPTVHQAHGIRDLLKCRGVIILAFTEDDYAGSSYGETTAECKQMAYTLDSIVADIESGRTPVWATAESVAAMNREAIRRGIEDGSYCGYCKCPVSDCDCRDQIGIEQYNEGVDE